MGEIGLHFPEHVVVGPHGIEGLREDDFLTVTLNDLPVAAVLFFPLPTLAERFKDLTVKRLGLKPPPEILEFLTKIQGAPN